jgi:hypothetical protein
MKTITISINWTMERASKEKCEHFNQPLASIEVIDEDGMRFCWARSEQHALDQVHDHFFNVFDSTDFDIVAIEGDQS